MSASELVALAEHIEWLERWSDHGQHKRIPGPTAGQAWNLAQELKLLIPILAARLPGDGWLPIESAPRDGTRIMLGNAAGAWMAEYLPVYTSGYRPPNPWFSVMLNHEHIPRDGRFAKPTHWQPLPPAPTASPAAGDPPA